MHLQMRIALSSSQNKSLFVLFLITLSLNSCSNLRFPGVYKIDIAQGNIITQDLLDKLKPQMSQNQVKYILGTPLITDTFNEDRWDYFYSLKKGKTGELKESRVTVYFDNMRYNKYVLIGEVEQSSVRREPRKRIKKQKKRFIFF